MVACFIQRTLYGIKILMNRILHFIIIAVAAICISCNGNEDEVQIVEYNSSSENIFVLTDAKFSLTATKDSSLAVYKIISTHTPSGEMVDNHLFEPQVTFTLKDSILTQVSPSDIWTYKLIAETDFTVHQKSYQVKEFESLNECNDCNIRLYWSDNYGVLQIHNRSWNTRQIFNLEDAVATWLNALIKNKNAI